MTLGKISGLVIDQSDYGSKVDEDDTLERASTIQVCVDAALALESRESTV